MENRIGLDAMRTIAIFLVLFLHSIYLLPKGMGKYIEYTSFFTSLDGVGIFFVLSGFLIGNFLLNLERENRITPKEISVFLAKRWLRTIPNYVLVLSFVLLFSNSAFNPKLLFFVQNYAKPYFEYFQESWSLSVEEHTYLYFPLVLFLMSFFVRKPFYLTGFTLIGFCILAKLYQGPDLDYLFSERTVLGRMSSIVMGLLFFKVFQNNESVFKRYRFAGLLAGVVLLSLRLHVFEAFNIGYYEYTSFAYILCLPFFYWLTIPNPVLNKIIYFTSKSSYSLYLINYFPFQYIILPFLKSKIPLDPSTLKYPFLVDYGLYWTVVPAISLFLYTYWEKPWMRLRRYLS